MKSFRDFPPKVRDCCGAAILVICAAGWAMTAKGALPSWMRNLENESALERAFFRSMPLPFGDVLFRRPPSETRPALTQLIQQQPAQAELYSLRALEDEQQLDFAAAEADWTLYVAKSSNTSFAQLALADFYHRRLRPQDEIAILSKVAAAPSGASEADTPAAEQRSWHAFERIFTIIQAQGLPKEVSLATYRAWVVRYPKESQLYSRFLEYLVNQKEFAAANQLIVDYEKQFPGDEIFQVKAAALVDYRQGSVQQGLAVYEKSFQPLWQPELVKSYFDLLAQTQNLRKFLDQARTSLKTNPEDLNATARVFYYYQQQGKLDAAEQAITTLRLHKEHAKSSWTPQELYTCGRLLEDIHAYPEAARYYFALYNSKDASHSSGDSQERSLTRLTTLLLTAPESSIRLSSGDLSIYKDIATMDQGPGYLNGIFSLLLNADSPQNEYTGEERRAIPYFHRSQAAELLALLDKEFPDAPSRPELHAKLLDFYSASAQSQAVLQGGRDFLATFPGAAERTRVALLMADADARLNRAQDEFAIYDAVLCELAGKAEGRPLGLSGSQNIASQQSILAESEDDEAADSQRSVPGQAGGAQQTAPNAAFQVNAAPSATDSTASRSPEYSRVLERYLARLVELQQIPQALGVLRREIDHNPDDPGLYERLANFLEQNRLDSEQEEIYRRAIARFPDRDWYNKLARFYLRHQKNMAFKKLSEEVIKEFDGSSLQAYLQSAGGGPPLMYVRLNEYAHTRFPHNPYFVRNLLMAYQYPPTRNPAAWEALLRQHWFEESDLRNKFFEYLSSNRKLDAELSALQQSVPTEGHGKWTEFVKTNPAAGQYLAQADLWRSHFEEGAPVLQALAQEYPADAELGRTASSVYRSLAYYDSSNTGAAVKIENNLLAARPGDTEILARIGDIYSDRELFAQAAPYWERIPKVRSGQPGGYLEAASIYWDYYDFANALRLLEEGRRKLGDENLYGYEEGAIYEGQRDYPHAVREYIKAALSASGDSPALNRLLDLARRPKSRELVNQESEKAVIAAHYSAEAINLRVHVLETENRRPELTVLLDAALANATNLEQAAEIATLAQQKSLESVQQRALEKQAALATDPVTRLQLRYALVHFYEGRKDYASVQKLIESLYRENPTILGVVRATVDFYWSAKLYPQGLAVLESAAKAAYPELSKQFIFEAARKSTEARQYVHARELLAQLLQDAPYNSEYLAAVADTYAQAGDQQGLKQFYLDKIALFRTAPLSADDRKTRIATLRRGLIPALTKLRDNSGAIDQYIEIINNFPEDEALVSEATLYSLRYKRQAQLVDFYARTGKESPRDFRWPMVLARIQTSLEDFPAAINAYGRSIAIRPDRVDLRIARATLAERLLRFDDAVSDYERLYQLAYKDPKWMQKVAELRVRQGRNEDAVAALKTALVDGVPERAENYFAVASQLEMWGILEPARSFAEQGVNAAGNELLAASQYHDGAKIYTRIMTRLRQQEKAYATLHAALAAASSSVPVVKEQVAKGGIAAISDREWREHALQSREKTARGGMQDAMMEMGSTVARYFTPEERVSFAAIAQQLRGPMDFAETEFIALPLAHSAGCGEEEARWRYELMMHAPEGEAGLLSQMSSLVALQRQRLKFAELGAQLEGFAPRVEPWRRPSILLTAAAAYRSTGDSDNELRVLASISPNYLAGDQQTRFLELLLAKRPQQLVQLASLWTPFGEQAADYTVSHGDAALAHAVTAARSQARPPIWGKAYNALVGLYFTEATPAVNKEFLSALGDQTIGERLGKPVDHNHQLAGDTWFYYGSRYGEYLYDIRRGGAALDGRTQADPEPFLSSALEQSPASASGYETLADYYADHGETASAIADYQHALELSSEQAGIHDRLAVIYFRDGKRGEAIAEWKLAFSTLLRQVNSVRVPESFWSDFAHTCEHLRSRKVLAPLRPEMESVVRAYLRHNGTYRSDEILRSAYTAFGDPVLATAWLLDVSASAQNSIAILSEIVDKPWIPLAQNGPIYQRILEGKQDVLAKSEGLEKQNAEAYLRSWQIRWIRFLLDTKQFRLAGEYLAPLLHDEKGADATAFVQLDLRIAAAQGTLDTKITGYRAEPGNAPSAESLRGAAGQLVAAGDKQSARKILEFVFAREIANHQLVAANFLGLAEIRIAVGDTPGALELFHRLVNVVGDTYQNMDSSAALLEKYGHYAEALAFLDPLARATPWNPSLRLRLAQARIAADAKNANPHEVLATLAAAPQIPYSLRVAAASALSGKRTTTQLGSVELQLLSGEPHAITIAAADQPFFYDARLRAAQNSKDAEQKLQILSRALADTPAREDARTPLFHAAAEIRSDEFALASIEEMLRDQRIRQLASSNTGDDQQTAGGDETASAEETSDQEEIEQNQGDASADTMPPPLPPPSQQMPAAQQAQLAHAVATVLLRLHRLSEALAYFQAAESLEVNARRRKQITSEIRELQARLQRQQLNTARQPILHANLEQDRLVRPKLAANAAAPIDSTASIGENP